MILRVLAGDEIREVQRKHAPWDDVTQVYGVLEHRFNTYRSSGAPACRVAATPSPPFVMTSPSRGHGARQLRPAARQPTVRARPGMPRRQSTNIQPVR